MFNNTSDPCERKNIQPQHKHRVFMYYNCKYQIGLIKLVERKTTKEYERQS